MKKIAKEGLYLMDTSSEKNWTSFRAYRRRIGASVFKSRSPRVDSQVEEATPSLRKIFYRTVNCAEFLQESTLGNGRGDS